MEWFKFDLSAWTRDTVDLSYSERGAYLTLLIAYYQTERGFPVDKSRLYRLIGAVSGRERASVDKILSRFFVLSEGMWINPRAEQEISEYQARRESRKGAARARWGMQNAMQVHMQKHPTNKQTYKPNGRGPVDNHLKNPLYCSICGEGKLAVFWDRHGKVGHCRDCGPVG